jgi:hypothetical protein
MRAESTAATLPRGRGAGPWLCRGAVPLLLLLLTLLLAVGGLAAAPAWIEGLAIRLGAEPQSALRALIAAQISLALLAAIMGRWSRGIALASLALLAFAAIAELSALAAAGGEPLAFAAPGAVLAIAGALLPAVLRARVSSGTGRRSGAWPAIAIVTIATAAVAIAARLPLSAPAEAEPPRRFAGEVVEFAFEDWPGRSLPDTGLPRHLPQLTPLTLEGRSVIVLYSPRCGSCHDLFRDWFATRDLPFRVIAVVVPPQPSATLLPSDQPERVDCPSCIDLSLPSGPLWLLQPPVVVAVKDGVVTGVATRPEQVAAALEGWLDP